MNMLWCWRCRAEMPMLDENEWERIAPLYGLGFRDPSKDRDERFGPLLNEYERLTGFRESNPNAIMHHRLALYGPPCEACGKPLRTPQARLCGACMHPRRVILER